MELEQPQLATFKYKHGTRARLTTQRKIFVALCLILAGMLSFVFFPFAIVAGLVSLVVFFTRGRTLAVGPRYLICGDEIIYYANVTQMALNEPLGRLELTLSSGKHFTLEREQFPTGARKTHKIAANQAAKFNKVSSRIIEKIRRTRPELANA